MKPAGPTSRRFRRRLTAAFVIVAAVSAGLVAVVTYVLAREYRWRNLQATAVEETRFAIALSPLDLDSASFERLIDVYALRSDAHIVAVAADQTLSSSDLGPGDVPATLADLTDEPVIVEADVADRPMLVTGAVGRDGVRYYLFFSLTQFRDSLDELARAAALSWFGTLVLAGAIGSVVARRTLRPIASAASAAEAIAGGDFDARLPDSSTDEFGVLARSFNNMADEVQRLIARLGAAAERERRFTADVAHELRTPLTGMAAASALLTEHVPDLPPAARRPADILVHDVDRLKQLVTELLELAQLDAATSEPDLVDLDLRTAIGAVVADAAARRTADIDVDVAPGLGVTAEPFALRRILGNLIDNAIKHGGGRITVRGRAVADEPASVVVDVIDDGAGISDHEAPRIFQRFHKSDRSRSGGGSGLGLAIAHDHAVRQGGGLVVGNEPGHGARFTLTLRGSSPAAARGAVDDGPVIAGGASDALS